MAVLAAVPAGAAVRPGAGKVFSAVLFCIYRMSNVEKIWFLRSGHTIFCVFHRFVTIFSNRKVTKWHFCCMIRKKINVLYPFAVKPGKQVRQFYIV